MSWPPQATGAPRHHLGDLAWTWSLGRKLRKALCYSGSQRPRLSMAQQPREGQGGRVRSHFLTERTKASWTCPLLLLPQDQGGEGPGPNPDGARQIRPDPTQQWSWLSNQHADPLRALLVGLAGSVLRLSDPFPVAHVVG